MTERIRQLICEINDAWKPDHFVYPVHDEEFPTVHHVPKVFERYRLEHLDQPPKTPQVEFDANISRRIRLEGTKLLIGAGHRRVFILDLETNAASAISGRGMAFGFYAIITGFEMRSRGHRFMPLVTNVKDLSDEIEAMEKYLSGILESLKSPTPEVGITSSTSSPVVRCS